MLWIGLVNVLLIEERADIRLLASVVLGASGMDVKAVASPADALIAAKQESFDVILLDFETGGGEGIDVMSVIRSDRALAHVPLIFLSTQGDPVEVAQMLAAGATGVIGKPFSPGALGDAIRSVLAGGESIVLSQPHRQAIANREVIDSLREYDEACEGFFATLAREFIEDSTTLIRKVRDLQTQGSHDELRAAVERLASSAGTVGATRLETEALNLRQALRNGPTDVDVDLLVGKLLELQSTTRKAYEELIAP